MASNFYNADPPVIWSSEKRHQKYFTVQYMFIGLTIMGSAPTRGIFVFLKME